MTLPQAVGAKVHEQRVSGGHIGNGFLVTPELPLHRRDLPTIRRDPALDPRIVIRECLYCLPDLVRRRAIDIVMYVIDCENRKNRAIPFRTELISRHDRPL